MKDFLFSDLATAEKLGELIPLNDEIQLPFFFGSCDLLIYFGTLYFGGTPATLRRHCNNEEKPNCSKS
jgi:hypothetical protein